MEHGLVSLSLPPGGEPGVVSNSLSPAALVERFSEGHHLPGASSLRPCTGQVESSVQEIP